MKQKKEQQQGVRLKSIPEHPPQALPYAAHPVSPGAMAAFAYALGNSVEAWKWFMRLCIELDPRSPEIETCTALLVLAKMRRMSESQPGTYPFVFLYRSAHLLPQPPTPAPATRRPLPRLAAAADSPLRIIDDAGIDLHAELAPRFALSGFEPLPLSFDVAPSKELGGFYAPYAIGHPNVRLDRAFRMQYCAHFHTGGRFCTVGAHCNFIHHDFWVRGSECREFQLCMPDAPEGEPGIVAVVVPEFDFQRFEALEALVDHHPINQANMDRFTLRMATKYETEQWMRRPMGPRPKGR